MIDILFGAAIGALLPLFLLICLAAIGFTCTGVIGCSVAACCQAPNVIAGGCFATMQSIAATCSIVFYSHYTAVLGAVGGLIYFIVIKCTN